VLGSPSLSCTANCTAIDKTHLPRVGVLLHLPDKEDRNLCECHVLSFVFSTLEPVFSVVIARGAVLAPQDSFLYHKRRK
jgi:hypothetical protein